MRGKYIISGVAAALICLGGAGAPRAGGRAVVWPKPARYKEAMHNSTTYLRDPKLAGATFARDGKGLPIVYSGSFSSVFPVTTSSGRRIALRMFHPSDAVPERHELDQFQQRWLLLGKQFDVLRRARRLPPEFVEFALVPNAVEIDGQLLPVMKLPWLTGRSLSDWVARRLSQGRAEALGVLARNWRAAMRDMRGAGLAHGDLHHENVMLESSGAMRFLDYDSVFAPVISHLANSEIGHQNFQHPSFHFPKPRLRPFNAEMDNFSALVIYLSLVAVAEDPGLWSRYHHDHNLIFEGKRDFLDPNGSPVFRELLASANPTTRKLAQELMRYSRSDPATLPPLETTLQSLDTPWYKRMFGKR